MVSVMDVFPPNDLPLSAVVMNLLIQIAARNVTAKLHPRFRNTIVEFITVGKSRGHYFGELHGEPVRLLWNLLYFTPHVL